MAAHLRLVHSAPPPFAHPTSALEPEPDQVRLLTSHRDPVVAALLAAVPTGRVGSVSRSVWSTGDRSPRLRAGLAALTRYTAANVRDAAAVSGWGPAHVADAYLCTVPDLLPPFRELPAVIGCGALLLPHLAPAEGWDWPPPGAHRVDDPVRMVRRAASRLGVPGPCGAAGLAVLGYWSGCVILGL